MSQPTTLCALLLLCCLTSSLSDAAGVTYTSSSAELLNPGRGWYSEFNTNVPGGDPIAANDLASARDGSPRQSLLQLNYWLIGNATLQFNQGAPLPDDFLTFMSNDFNTIRQSGMKVILRFGYTNQLTSQSGPYGDAPLSVASAHIDQISPILKANADVIFTLQAGFIGVWGEWYYTDYYGGVGASDNPDRKTLLDRLMSATSSSTPIGIRTPSYKYQLLNRTTNLAPSEAYSSSTVARLGFHDDCFVASNDDEGTYINPSFDYPYLGNETMYTTMGGETCENVTRSGCYASTGGATMTELARFHWKYLNIGYNEQVIATWQSQGCYNSITQGLGYRLLLSPTVTHTYTDAVRPGRSFAMSFVIENEGFSAPLHQVNVYLVLVSQSTVWAKLPVDPRFWLPESSPFALAYTLGVGSDVPEGNYTLALLFADALIAPSPADGPRPYYSIQLANEGTWNGTAGYTDLGVTVQVSASAPDTGAYSGSLWIGSEMSSGSAVGVHLPSLVGALLVLALVPFLLF